MKTTWKRMLSLLLIAAMVLSFGATGYAADVDEDLILDEPEAEIIALGDRDIEGHDVNNDRVTDYKDVQAILDYLAFLLDAEDIDAEAADLDGDELVSSYDAYLLLQYLFEEDANRGIETPGSLTAFHSQTDSDEPEMPDPIVLEPDEDGLIRVEIQENEDATNGLICLTYDPDYMALEEASSDLVYHALFNDEEKCVITFAYANRTALPAGTVLAELVFAPNCEDSWIDVQRLELNDVVDELFYLAYYSIENVSHDWNNPTYIWADDNSEATATHTCRKCGQSETETVKTTSEVTWPASCEEPGETTYTAIFTNPAFETQIKTVEGPAPIGHDWEFTGFVWTNSDTDGRLSAGAEYVCRNDDSHYETVNATVTSEITEPSCTEAGKTVYTATVTAEDSLDGQPHSGTREEDIPATGHDWADPSYVWSEDNSTVTATRICRNGDHPETETATATSEVTKEATCEEPGELTYTATFTNPAFETRTKTVDIPATGHTPGEPVKENEVAPGCETEGSYDEVVYCTVCGKELSREKKTIPATGHTPGEPVKENEVAPGCETEGSYDEVVYCTVCGKELSREKKTIPATGHTPGEPVKENEVAPGCETEGSYDEVVYCTVCHKELSRETKTIPATGHEWVGIAYEWAEDNSSCTARAHCSHNDSHILDISVKTTYEVITEPTTEKEGLGRYTAVFEAPFETQTKDVVIDKIPSTDGYPITVTEYTNGVVSCTLESGALYSGETEFIVNGSGGKAVLVVAKVEDSYTVLPCHITTVGTHTVHYFIVTPTAPTEIILVFKGDANLDGKVNLRDAQTIKNHVGDNLEEPLSEIAILAGNVNGDTKLNLRDAKFIKEVIAGDQEIAW